MIQKTDQKKSPKRVLAEPFRVRPYTDQQIRINKLKIDRSKGMAAEDYKDPKDPVIVRELLDAGLEAKGYPQEVNEG